MTPSPADEPDPDLSFDADDDTRAAFALMDAVGWVELAVTGGAGPARVAAAAAEPEVAVAALLEVAARVAELAGGYACDADETEQQAAVRLLGEVRQGFGRQAGA